LNWKQYKALPPKEKYNETYYIIGLDIGSETSGIAFYNLHENAPEPIDLSGGYGKPSIPTVIQFIPETKEWVFGEYAILNQGTDTEITLTSLIENLGRFDYADIDNKTVSAAYILGLFIKELLGNVRNINPRAVIVGIIAAVPDKLSPEATDELKRAFKYAGYEKELIALVPGRECVLSHYFHNRRIMHEEKILMLDYGSREVRGGVYTVNKIDEKNRITAVTAQSSLFDENIGTRTLFKAVNDFFMSFYKKHSHIEAADAATLDIGVPDTHLHEQLAAFTYQHKDILFQKNIRSKPIKLYYNFAFPPFQQIITHADIKRLIITYIDRFANLIVDVRRKTIGCVPISARDIDTIICTGGGFEMLWPREIIQNIFEPSKIYFYKNAKLVAAEGAALVAATHLGVTPGHNFEIEDTHQLSGDIGIKSGDAFLPLALRSTFWWQTHQSKLVLVNSKVNGNIDISITERSQNGNERILASPSLTGLPKRPKGTTRLMFGVNFISDTRMTLKVSDIGFGEMFPPSSYQQEFSVKIA